MAWFIYIIIAYVVIGLLILLSGIFVKYTSHSKMQDIIGWGLIGTGMIMLPLIPPL